MAPCAGQGCQQCLESLVMSHSLLAQLAQLLLKTQQEFSGEAPLFAAPSPFQMGLTLGGTTVSSRWTSGTSADAGLQLTFCENGNTYRVHIPARADAQGKARVTVTLQPPNGKPEEYTFEGSDLAKAQFAEPFRTLHSKVLAYLRKTHGAALFQATEGSKPETAAQGTSEVAPAADSSTAAPEADQKAEADPHRWYRVARVGQPDLRFKGQRVAYVQTPLRQGRQHVYSLYATPSGKHVAIKEGLSVWLNERNIVEVKVLEKLEECVDFFGYSGLAKALYQQIGMTHQAEEVLE